MNLSKIVTLFWIAYFTLLALLGLLFFLSQPNLPIQAFVIQSGSMEPTIMTGDLALIKTTYDQAKIGDVITFKNLKDTVVTHRIIEEVTTGPEKVFITKGDNNQAPDPDPVPLANLIGIWFFAIPKMGYVLVGLRTPLGLSLMVSVPIILLLLAELIKKPNLNPTPKPVTLVQPVQPVQPVQKSLESTQPLLKLPTVQSVLAEANSGSQKPVVPQAPSLPPSFQPTPVSLTKTKITVESL